MADGAARALMAGGTRVQAKLEGRGPLFDTTLGQQRTNAGVPWLTVLRLCKAGAHPFPLTSKANWVQLGD